MGTIKEWYPHAWRSHRKANLTNVLIDKAQMGLACIDSWSALPEPEFMLPYGDYEFTFIMTPVKNNIVTK